jgi:hypothetical protein
MSKIKGQQLFSDLRDLLESLLKEITLAEGHWREINKFLPQSGEPKPKPTGQPKKNITEPIFKPQQKTPSPMLDLLQGGDNDNVLGSALGLKKNGGGDDNNNKGAEQKADSAKSNPKPKKRDYSKYNFTEEDDN